MARIFCSTSRFCDTICEVRRWCLHHRSYCSETYKSDLLKSTPDKYICLFLVLFAIQTLKLHLGYTYRQFSKSGQTWNEHNLRHGSRKRMFGHSLFRPSRQSNIPTSGEERFKYPLPWENKISQMPYPRANKDNQIPTPWSCLLAWISDITSSGSLTPSVTETVTDLEVMSEIQARKVYALGFSLEIWSCFRRRFVNY